MSNGSSKTEACGQAVISAASESYTGRCSSSLSGLGGHYTLGLLQTPRSTADSTGGFSSGGAGLTPFRAAGSGGKEPPRSGRGESYLGDKSSCAENASAVNLTGGGSARSLNNACVGKVPFSTNRSIGRSHTPVTGYSGHY